MTELGMAPIDSVRSAAQVCAELLGIAEKVGTPRRGSWRTSSRCRGSDAGYPGDGAGVLRDEGREDHQERAVGARDPTLVPVSADAHRHWRWRCRNYTTRHGRHSPRGAADSVPMLLPDHGMAITQSLRLSLLNRGRGDPATPHLWLQRASTQAKRQRYRLDCVHAAGACAPLTRLLQRARSDDGELHRVA